MATKINPPKYSQSKSYELYKQELLAWKEITELEKKKRGVAIALTLPEDDDSKIREKVFDQIKLEDLKKETGLETLIEFLDKHLAKDDLADSLTKFEDFEDYRRAESQTIVEYISVFDAKYRKIEKKEMKLPPEILAFKLLRRANISKEETMIVLTGMNYDEKATLYEQAKSSLKKFKGEVCDSGTSHSSGPSIKLEPAFLAENEEALLAAGYVRSNAHRPGFSGGRRGGRGRAYDSMKQQGYRQTEYTPFKAPSGQRQGGLKKDINPTGSDGKLLTCKSCGSYRHMITDCPHSWENMAKVNTFNTEHAVLFTGFQREDMSRLCVDAQNCAVLDSACSSTVCGQTWFNNYIESLSGEDRKKIKGSDSKKVFKFGGGTCLKSNGEFSIPAVLADKSVTIQTDVVESDIPLLLSKDAMKKAGVKMDLENDTATILGKEIALNLTTAGHYCVPIDKCETVAVSDVCKEETQASEKLSQEKLLKLHRQFAHPPIKKLVALLKDAKNWKEEYYGTLSDIERKCEICKLFARTPPRPVVALPLVTAFNEKVAMDLKKVE